MYFFKGESTGETCSLFTYTRPWNVSTTTWNQADSGVMWTSPGGDFKRDFVAWTPFADSLTWENFDVTLIVREFLQNPDSNFGFFLKTGYNNIERRYYSSDYEVDSLRPKLTITTSTAITNKFSKQGAANSIRVNSVSKVVSFYVPFEDDYVVSIVNTRGSQIYSALSSKMKSFSVSLKNSSAGIYMVRVTRADRPDVFYSRKFILR